MCESVYVCSVSSTLRSPTHQECLVSYKLDHSPYHTTRRTVLHLSRRSILGDVMSQQRRVFSETNANYEYEYERVVNPLFVFVFGLPVRHQYERRTLRFPVD